jgi:CHAT domain-containing protein
MLSAGKPSSIVDFYMRMQKREPRGEALRNAELKMIKSGRDHPYFWASFIEVGDWRSIQ